MYISILPHATRDHETPRATLARAPARPRARGATPARPDGFKRELQCSAALQIVAVQCAGRLGAITGQRAGLDTCDG